LFSSSNEYIVGVEGEASVGARSNDAYNRVSHQQHHNYADTYDEDINSPDVLPTRLHLTNPDSLSPANHRGPDTESPTKLSHLVERTDLDVGFDPEAGNSQSDDMDSKWKKYEAIIGSLNNKASNQSFSGSVSHQLGGDSVDDGSALDSNEYNAYEAGASNAVGSDGPQVELRLTNPDSFAPFKSEFDGEETEQLTQLSNSVQEVQLDDGYLELEKLNELDDSELAKGDNGFGDNERIAQEIYEATTSSVSDAPSDFISRPQEESNAVADHSTFTETPQDRPNTNFTQPSDVSLKLPPITTPEENMGSGLEALAESAAAAYVPMQARRFPPMRLQKSNDSLPDATNNSQNHSQSYPRSQYGLMEGPADQQYPAYKTYPSARPDQRQSIRPHPAMTRRQLYPIAARPQPPQGYAGRPPLRPHPSHQGSQSSMQRPMPSVRPQRMPQQRPPHQYINPQTGQMTINRPPMMQDPLRSVGHVQVNYEQTVGPRRSPEQLRPMQQQIRPDPRPSYNGQYSEAAMNDQQAEFIRRNSGQPIMLQPGMNLPVDQYSMNSRPSPRPYPTGPPRPQIYPRPGPPAAYRPQGYPQQSMRPILSGRPPMADPYQNSPRVSNFLAQTERESEDLTGIQEVLRRSLETLERRPSQMTQKRLSLDDAEMRPNKYQSGTDRVESSPEPTEIFNPDILEDPVPPSFATLRKKSVKVRHVNTAEKLEMYRQSAKRSNDPALLFEYAK
jgi:hypothetical protein